MAATAGSSQVASSQLKRNSDDMGWEFAVLIDPNDPQRVKCKLCGKEMSGRVTRMKEHICSDQRCSDILFACHTRAASSV